jgi:hypothetical protein
MYYPLFPLHKNFKQRTAIRVLEETMSGKWLNSRTYGLMTLLFGIPGILSIAVSQVYLPAGSLYTLPLLVLGLFLVVVSVVFLFFFFTMQWRWTHGQPQPRPMR